MSNASEDDYKLLRETVREFVRKEVIPISARIDSEDYFPSELFKKMGKMGFLGVTVPEEYGGSGMGYRAQAIISEELGYGSASLALSYAAHSNLCLDNIYRNGSEYLRGEFVPKLASGEFIGSLCLTEPQSGSDALNMRTTSEISGDNFIINGSKTFITNAPYADLFLVYSRFKDAYNAYCILSTDQGFSRGKKFDKMGMRGSPTGEIFFDSVSVNKNRLLGKIGGGKEIILSGLNSERVILSFIFIGVAKRAMELALQYSTSRKQSGKYIGEFQMIQEKLAYMYTKLRTSRLLSEESLRLLSEDPMDSVGAACAILHSTESAEYIARETIQIYGGYGYIKENEPERLLRDAILGQIGAGTTEIRKKLVASGIIKRFKENSIQL